MRQVFFFLGKKFLPFTDFFQQILKTGGRKQDFITRTSAEVFREDLGITEIMSLFYDNVNETHRK